MLVIFDCIIQFQLLLHTGHHIINILIVENGIPSLSTFWRSLFIKCRTMLLEIQVCEWAYICFLLVFSKILLLIFLLWLIVSVFRMNVGARAIRIIILSYIFYNTCKLSIDYRLLNRSIIVDNILCANKQISRCYRRTWFTSGVSIVIDRNLF